MGAFEDLEIHYAIEDIEDIKDVVEQLQTMVQSAEAHPKALPQIMDAIHSILLMAVIRMKRRLAARSDEIEKLIKDDEL